MLPFDRIKLYSQTVDGIRYYPLDKEHPFLIVYFSENSTLVEDFPRLNIRLPDVKVVCVPTSKLPRTKLTSPYRKQLRSLGLFSFIPGGEPKGRSILYDTSLFIPAVDEALRPTNYRQRAGLLIKTTLMNAFATFPDYRKVLLYVVDVNKPFGSIINRKIFPVLQQLKKEGPFFDSFALCILGDRGARYRLLMRNGEYKFEKLYVYVKAAKYIETEEQEKEAEATQAAEEVSTSVEPDIKPENKEKVKAAVRDYLRKDDDSREKVTSKVATPDDHKRIATAAILNKVSGNYERARQVSDVSGAKKNLT